MNFPRLIALSALLLAAGFPPLSHAALATPLPVTDNTAPPYLGVWEPMYQGTGWADRFGKWLNRKGLYSVVTQYVYDEGGWPAIADRYWVDPGWAKWAAVAPGRRLVIINSIPTDSASLEKAAKGGFNDKATEVAKYLVANNLTDSILCMGLIKEENSWGRASAADAANFALAWQQIVTAMRAVPGAEKLQFDWVGMNQKTSFPLESAYPGDAYVDYVGMFLYDRCLDKGIYPLPANATDDDKLAHRKKAWDQYYFPAEQNGLEAWRAVAQAHHKPFSVPLWCLYSDHYEDGTLSTGGDNTFFIQQMHDFIQDPGNNVAFSCYDDIYHLCTRIVPDNDKDPTAGLTYPNSTALFKKLFGFPDAPTPASTPGNP